MRFGLVLSFLIISLSATAWAASGDEGSPGAFAGTNWTTPDSTVASDDEKAYYANAGQDDMKLADFSVTVPLGATIDSIIVTIEGNGGANPAAGRQIDVALTKDGVAEVGDVVMQDLNKNSDVTYTVRGSTNDLWNTTWSPAEINADTWGVFINKTSASTDEIRIDSVSIRVYWTPGYEEDLYPNADGDTTQWQSIPFGGATYTQVDDFLERGSDAYWAGPEAPVGRIQKVGISAPFDTSKITLIDSVSLVIQAKEPGVGTRSFAVGVDTGDGSYLSQGSITINGSSWSEDRLTLTDVTTKAGLSNLSLRFVTNESGIISAFNIDWLRVTIYGPRTITAPTINSAKWIFDGGDASSGFDTTGRGYKEWECQIDVSPGSAPVDSVTLALKETGSSVWRYLYVNARPLHGSDIPEFRVAARDTLSAIFAMPNYNEQCSVRVIAYAFDSLNSVSTRDTIRVDSSLWQDYLSDADTYIDETAPTANFNTNSQVRISYMQITHKQVRALFKFTGISAPSGDSIYWLLNLSGWTTVAGPVHVAVTTSDWLPDSVTWDDRREDVAWTTGGGDTSTSTRLIGVSSDSSNSARSYIGVGDQIVDDSVVVILIPATGFWLSSGSHEWLSNDGAVALADSTRIPRLVASYVESAAGRSQVIRTVIIE